MINAGIGQLIAAIREETNWSDWSMHLFIYLYLKHLLYIIVYIYYIVLYIVYYIDLDSPSTQFCCPGTVSQPRLMSGASMS